MAKVNPAARAQAQREWNARIEKGLSDAPKQNGSQDQIRRCEVRIRVDDMVHTLALIRSLSDY